MIRDSMDSLSIKHRRQYRTFKGSTMRSAQIGGRDGASRRLNRFKLNHFCSGRLLSTLVNNDRRRAVQSRR